MININMPEIVEILIKHLAVVVGEVDGIEEMIPDWFGDYVVNVTELDINTTLYVKFQDNGKCYNDYSQVTIHPSWQYFLASR
jgi:hypothetical protein